VTARSVEREIEAVLRARTEQIPELHDVCGKGGTPLSLAGHIELLHRLLGVHSELILRLAREVDSLAEG
jgi:hypothetical protein